MAMVTEDTDIEDMEDMDIMDMDIMDMDISAKGVRSEASRWTAPNSSDITMEDHKTEKEVRRLRLKLQQHITLVSPHRLS